MTARKMSSSSILSIFTILRRQQWLYRLYSRLPPKVRRSVSLQIADRANKKFRFVRTEAWQSASLAVPIAVDASAHVGRPDIGVNVFAYLRGQFGLAEAARGYINALLESGYPVALHDIDLNLPHGFEDRSMDELIGNAAPYPINLVFVNPDYLEHALQRMKAVNVVDRPTVACWFWELEKIPDQWLPSLDSVDGVMVASPFIAEAFRACTGKPVFEVPLPVAEMPDSGLQREDFGLDPDDFVFLTSFDFNSWMTRKNPLASISAFKLAFPSGTERVRLLLKSSNGRRFPQQFAEMLEAVAGDPRIIVRDDVLEREHMQALQRCVDAYVSLHRAEGFGLGLAECMAIGKPVVATAWSGNMAFMTSQNSCLVDLDLIPVRFGEYLDTEGQRWGDPHLHHAASHMRRLVEQPAFAKAIGRQASADIATGLSRTVAAARMIGLFEDVLEQREANSSRLLRQGNENRGGML